MIRVTPDAAELARCKRSSACGGDGMSLSHAHGFMTAVARAPDPLDEAERIHRISDEPVFAKVQQAGRIPGLAQRLNRDIERGPTLDDRALADGLPQFAAAIYRFRRRQGEIR